MRDCITLRRLQQIAIGTATTNGLNAPTREEITRTYYAKGAKALPLIKRCDAGCVWVDRYYMAYQIGDGDVHYAYISKHHIREEVSAYRAAARERETANRMPEDIRAAFRTAREYMKAKATEIWVEPRWRDGKTLV